MLIVFNAGSSSLKFAGYTWSGSVLICQVRGSVQSLGKSPCLIYWEEPEYSHTLTLTIDCTDIDGILETIFLTLVKRFKPFSLRAVGHRIVHGRTHETSCLIDERLLSEWEEFNYLDPEHLPLERALIDFVTRTFPNVPQFACFDTAFFHDLPIEASRLPFPAQYDSKGLRRYGFHGLSYQSLLKKIYRREGELVMRSRLVLCHLGNGSSLAAIKDGKPIDTSMGFTPCSGIPMGSRSGDIDPNIAYFLLKQENISLDAFHELVHHECGLLGLSGISADMEILLSREKKEPRAAEAVNLYCYAVKKQIGAYAAALGGIDLLVFSGGIGENAPEIRRRICENLDFLGIELHEEANAKNKYMISRVHARTMVLVIPTDEQATIAELLFPLLPFRSVPVQ